MAKKNKDNNKLMIGLCSAVAVIVVVVVAIILATRGTNLDDSYFVSDGTKYVLTVESDELDFSDDEAEYTPIKTHIVYTYSGDEITGMKTYAEYSSPESAKAAFEALKSAGEETEGAEVNGKYIVMTNTPDQYEGMTSADVKQQVEVMEMLKNMNLDNNKPESTTETETE